MSFLSKIFSKGAKDILDSSGNIIDELNVSDDEKMSAKNKLSETVFSALNNLQNVQKEIIVSETSGNWLQRSWRPIIMLSFGFIVVYTYFIQPAFFPNAVSLLDKLNADFWGLLKLGMGGYVIGRSVEKVSKELTKNADISLLRKKDRKDVYG